MPTYLITGSGKGIGLGLAEALLRDPQNYVIATTRNPASSPGLQQLSDQHPKERLVILPLDVTVPEQMSSLAKEVEKLLPNGLDYFIHNAGIWAQQFTPVEELDVDQFEEEVKFYTVPVVHLLREFKPLILQSSEKKVIFVSTNLASFTLATLLPDLGIPYCVGKAAQNMLARKWGIVNKSLGITTIMLHPGWVDTFLGQVSIEYMRAKNPSAKPIPVEESVSGMMKVIHSVKLEDAATFWSYTGEILPW
ncbi:NAD(P)-binding protein [Panus rudis PR-1116 ss-1]|nr:NAD(P)-binding protein [Panus rudis PR-1116 ss-1]